MLDSVALSLPTFFLQLVLKTTVLLASNERDQVKLLNSVVKLK
jgi:hypothetical protein